MEDKIFDHISQALLYLIHIVPRLKYLFLRWCVLDMEHRDCIDYEMLQKGINMTENTLYKSLRKAFVIWEHVQDTEGAPGFQADANEYRLDIELQDKITKMLDIFEIVLSKIEIQQNLVNATRNICVTLKIASPINIKRSSSTEKINLTTGTDKSERRRSF